MKTNLITHLGGEHCVTGSCHLLRANGLGILVDCGLAQGRDTALPVADWPVQPADLDYLFLTHAHIDHIGRLPELIDKGFRGEILCSHPTKALLEPMLNDAMGFSGTGAEEKKKILRRIDELSWGFEYQQEFKLKNGVTFSFGRAGHILGSCFIRFEFHQPKVAAARQVVPSPTHQPPPVKGHGHQGCDVDPGDPQTGKPFSVIFSGDLGNKDTPLLCDPDPPPHCDLLLLESTYGNRLHEGRRQRLARLEEVLGRALKDKGKVLIPAFALGRTQEILYELDRLFGAAAFQKYLLSSGLQNLPVVVDSPLGVKLTEIYADQKAYWDSEAHELLNKGDNPIDFKHLFSSVNSRDHQQLLKMPGPAIIMAGSGMCTGGRILDHLAATLDDPKTDILFVGYQAQGTLGREIARGSGQGTNNVTIHGQKIRLRATVHTLSGYSAHADQQGLLDWVAAMPQRPGAIKLVHGETRPRPLWVKNYAGKGILWSMAIDTIYRTRMRPTGRSLEHGLADFVAMIESSQR